VSVEVIIFLLIVAFFFLKRKKPPTIIPVKSPAKEFVITWRSNKYLGVYKGVKIADKIKLEDGRSFTFESIAVVARPGLYLADDQDGSYVVVDNCLLYKEYC
jgi:hypothetical protein